MKYTDIEITAESGLELLTNDEIARLSEHSQGGDHELFKKCVLAVLNSTQITDELDLYEEQLKYFDVEVLQLNKGVKLKLKNAPSSALVEGEMIQGLKEQVFSVLRDIVFLKQELESNSRIDFNTSNGCTNAIFHILRNAKALKPGIDPNIVVCWGGHAIPEFEYQYTKEVGYRLGLRGLDIITGCGIGAMKGPMKGALVGHSKQRKSNGRYIGITEPGIIAAESPNPIVNELIIMPDIEKRLETFVRLGHSFVVFPGGVGTAEEILYILGILLHPENKNSPFPLIFTGPKESSPYFERIDRFIGDTLGTEAQQKYKIIIDDPVAVAHAVQEGVYAVREYRKSTHDAFHFNWQLKIQWDFQEAFDPTHKNMSELNLNTNQPLHSLAANLRKAFSGIVAGNIKEKGISEVTKHGPYHINGDRNIMDQLDALLEAFVSQGRMKLNAADYVPCYRVLKPNKIEEHMPV
ncbi:nucleotide 5'-monophosphate nucleosidase PpnN [Kangiella sediminilitoris]|uniref:AMP nucleosidase n=1 Tax=Kangiella sediminilitoris TaxID=1144748 RepID=A0A1B3BB23_9GAMM|nr:nucleotide 5'-monophosphate nucleosidase PpnN [Kangiella sediminilitoris]AOE49995.1 LOG family protein [Kangiella sediminilitoris]